MTNKRVSPSIAIASTLIGSGFLLNQVVRTESYAALIVLFAALIVGCLPRASVRDVVAASVAPAGLAVALSRGAVIVKEPLASIHAQDPGQDLVIALMIGLFALNMEKKWIAIATAAFVLLSLPFHGVALLAIAVGTLATRAPRETTTETAAPPPSLLAWAPAILAAFLGVASLFPRTAKPELAPEDDPRAAVEYWRQRENLFRARHVALAWATKEGAVPRDGYLTLAMVDWDLGEHEKAQKVLTKIIARTDDPSVLERANALASSWGLSP